MQNFSQNFTRPQIRYDFSIFNASTMPVFIVFAILSWMVNINLVITIFIDRLHCLKKASGWFVANLSIASTISATTAIIFATQFVSDIRIKNEHFWTAIRMLMGTTGTCEGFSILAISLERLFLVCRPIRYKIFMTQEKAKGISIVTWFIAIGINGLFVWFNKDYPTVYRYCRLLTIAIVLFIIVINGMTFFNLKKMNKGLDRITDNVVHTALLARLKVERTFSRVVLMLLFSYVFFASPILVVHTLIKEDQSCAGCLFAGKVPFGTLYFVSLILAQFHALNIALLYLVLIPKYRQSFIADWKLFLSFFSKN